MANTLTNLTPTLYEALDIVSRELVGFIPAVFRDSNAERAALNQTIRVPVTTQDSASDITPGTTAPDTGDTTVNNQTITISKSRKYPVRFNGEETRGLGTAGTYQTILRDRFAQGMRTLCNEVEADLAGLYTKGSRAYGTAATTPFGTKDNLTDFAGVAQILDENGAPRTDRQLVVSTAAMANLRGVQTGLLQKVNEAGTAEALRQGQFGAVHGLVIRDSNEIDSHTKGTGTGYLLNDASSAVGDTTIAADTGSGTIVAGDVVTFAGTSHKYIVNTALSGGSFVINEPGLKVAETDDDAITVGADYTANFAFHRNALVLVTRAPALPDGGDMADDSMMLTDPVSGLSFEIRMYRQYRQLYMEVALAWGVACVAPRHTAILLG